MKRLFLILTLLSFASVANGQLTVTEGPIARPLPQIIQNMSNEEYATWVIWHNLVTARKAGEKDEKDGYTGPKWLYGEVTNSYKRGSGRGATNNRGPRGVRSSNQFSSSRGRTSVNTNHSSFSHTRNYQYRYLNPDYTSPGSITIYNPFVRHKGSLGYPDYENIYLPTPKGPQSMADLILAPSEKTERNNGITSEEAVKLIEKYGSSWYDHVEEVGL